MVFVTSWLYLVKTDTLLMYILAYKFHILLLWLELQELKQVTKYIQL